MAALAGLFVVFVLMFGLNENWKKNPLTESTDLEKSQDGTA